ncbi:Methionine adenosyltransferase 2 subunit beta [Termitomyces sp. J132]|nr:Methionine adenosyltransferase 2 subunit beta [Termitomyces sp. J132]
MPAEIPQMNNIGEAMAILEAIKEMHAQEGIRILSDSKLVIDSLTKYLGKNKDDRWIGTANKLNVQVPGHLASLSKKLSFTLVYISTDYVFDGTSPPYIPSSPTNPLQSYGQSKRDGELAVLAVNEASVIVLRVPVLQYGPTPNNSDSAINILLDVVQDQSGKVYKMDHYATRYPTNILDIAQFLVRLSGYKKSIPPILHYSAAEPYTKYEICLVLSKILNLPHEHIVPDAQSPTGTGAPTRPRDCQLYTRETEELHIGENGDASLGLSLFEEWWTTHLKGK